MKPQIETLEARRLLSQTWQTVDDAPTSTFAVGISAMTSDAAGNVYASGSTIDSAGLRQHLIRMKPADAGADEWSTVYVGPAAWPRDIAVAPNGDIYAFNAGTVLEMERSAGKTSFVTVDQSWYVGGDVEVDAAGNVYSVGQAQVQVGTKGKTPLYEYRWTVRKQTGGQGAFTTVDSYTHPEMERTAQAMSVSVIPTGPAAGIYVAGIATTRHDAGGNGGGDIFAEHWLVRRSTDGGATWSLVDRFDMPTPGSARPAAVTGDANGNVYVAGTTLERVATTTRRGVTTYSTTERWVTRRGVTDSGGSLTWSQVDSQPSTGWGNTVVSDAAVDGSGNAYVIASAYDGSANASVIRGNVGGSWQTVDHFQLAAGRSTSGRALAVDAAGNVFAGGGGLDVAGVAHWLVRSPAVAITSATFSTIAIRSGDPSPADDSTLAEELLGVAA